MGRSALHRAGTGGALTSQAPPRLLTVPNLISAGRVALAGVFLIVDGAAVRLGVLAAGAVSDWVDGWIARRFHQSSRAGELIDPAADRILVLAVLAAFLLEDRVQLWEAGLFLLRDVFTTVAGVAVWFARLPVRLRARKPGKRVTLVQLGALLVLFVRPGWSEALAVAVAVISVWAIADYVRLGMSALRGSDAG